MSLEKKVWKDPQPLKVVYNKVVRKSRSGVEYTDYVPVIQKPKIKKGEETPPNRHNRRKQAAWERSATYRKAMKDAARRDEKKHAEIVAKSKVKKAETK